MTNLIHVILAMMLVTGVSGFMVAWLWFIDWSETRKSR